MCRPIADAVDPYKENFGCGKALTRNARAFRPLLIGEVKKELARFVVFYIITIMPKKIDHQTRRKDIARAAVNVIGVNGIENTRLIDVAREAKVTTGSITHYFEGKDAVMLAALDHVAQKILHLLQTPRDADVSVDALIEMASRSLPLDEEGQRDWRVWLSFFSRAVGDPSLARINNAYYDEFRLGISAVLRALQAEKKLRGNIDTITVADSIITAVDGLGVRAALDPARWTAERQTQQLKAMLLPLLPTP